MFTLSSPGHVATADPPIRRAFGENQNQPQGQHPYAENGHKWPNDAPDNQNDTEAESQPVIGMGLDPMEGFDDFSFHQQIAPAVFQTGSLTDA